MQTLLSPLPSFPKGLWTTQPGAPFLETLASSIRQLLPTAQNLARAIVILPYDRARHHFTSCLRGEAPATLLPQLHHLGTLTPLLQYFGLPPSDTKHALSTLERTGLLLQLIQAKHQQLSASTKDTQENYPFTLSLTLAEDFVRVLDAIAIEEVSLKDLKHLVPEAFSAHWQITLDFLSIISEAWPNLLKEKGVVDPMTLATQEADALIAYFRHMKPEVPVILAGSTGSVPRVKRLMRAISDLPQGAVILPGFDTDLYRQVDTFPAYHPQRPMVDTVEFLSDAVKDISIWPLQASLSDTQKQKQTLIRYAATPTLSTAHTHRFALDTQSIRYLEVETETEEALAIALAVRRALAEGTQTVTVCAPSSLLGERVQTQLQRWGITADHSSNSASTTDQPGRFLRALLAYVKAQQTPETAWPALLTLLKQPLWRQRFSQQAHTRFIALAENSLRTPFPLLTWQQWQETLSADPKTAPIARHLTLPLTLLVKTLKPFCTNECHALSVWGACIKETLCKFFGNLSTWRVIDILDAMDSASDAFSPLCFNDFSTLLEKQLQEVRVHTPLRARVQILGSLEARLVSTDTLILSGLNEGTWPALEPENPWLNRTMRTHLGLMDSERKQALSAHDFFQGCTAPHVILTRAKKDQGTPTAPSRLLTSLIKAAERLSCPLTRAHDLETWARTYDHPDKITPCTAPAPRPPQRAFPRKISATALERLARDPYAFYAAYILHLKMPLPLGGQANQAFFGTLAHDLLERSLTDITQKALPETQWLDTFNSHLEEALLPFATVPSLDIFARQRLLRLAPSFFQACADILQHKILCETWGAVTQEIAGVPIMLHARADRIDLAPKGAVIIDYKTGAPPSQNDIVQGFSPQLPLEGALYRSGGFSKAKTAKPTLQTLAFWHLGSETLTIKAIDAPEEAAHQVLQQARALLTRYVSGQTPFYAQPIPAKAPVYNDYTHLERLAEWRP